MPPRKRLGQLLTELKVIDEHQLQSALGTQKQWGGKLGTILVQKGFCKEESVVRALSQHLGMPVVRLADQKIDPRAVKFVSKQLAEKLHVFAYEVSGTGRGEVVTIAMSDPTDLSAVDQLAFHTGKRIKPMLCGDSEVVSAVALHYGESPALAASAPAASAAQATAPQNTIPSRITPTQLMAARPALPPVRQGPGPAGFPRRFEPAGPPPVMTPMRPLAPYIPPPAPPRAAPVPVPQAAPLEEIEPMDADALAGLTPPLGAQVAEGGETVETQPAPAVEPIALEDEDAAPDSPMEGLEPIAAHSQGAESIEGSEEVRGQGSAGEAVEGLQHAASAIEGAEAPIGETEPLEGLEPIAAHSQAAKVNSEATAAPDAGWDSAPDASWDSAPAASWDSAPAAAAGWELPAVESPAAAASADWGDAPSAAEPAVPLGDFGAAQDWSVQGEEEAPALDREPAAAAPAETAWGSEEPAAEEPVAEGALEEAPADELPADAIMGTADGVAAPAEENGLERENPAEALPVAEHAAAREADVWGAAAQSAAAAEGGAWDGVAAESVATDAQATPAEAPPTEPDPFGEASSERTDPDLPSPLYMEAAEHAHEELAAEESPWGVEEPAAGEAAPHQGIGAIATESSSEIAETEAPAAWADEPAVEAPLAAAQEEQAAEPEQHAEPPQHDEPTQHDEPMQHAESTQHAEPIQHDGPEGHEDVAWEYRPAETVAAAAEERAAPEPAAGDAAQSDLLQGWVPPPPEQAPEGTGWIGEALAATAPLAPADLDTLAEVGLDPHDGLAALRLLAGLLRALARHSVLDLGALAADMRNSHAQGAAALATAEHPAAATDAVHPAAQAPNDEAAAAEEEPGPAEG